MRKRLYIADSDARHVAAVYCAVSRTHEIEIIGTESDGHRALRDILAKRPDILLLDVQLPGMDGIALLMELQRMEKPPVGIICTRFYSDVVVDVAQKNGASYVLFKPILYDRLPGIMLELCRIQQARRQAEQKTRSPSAHAPDDRQLRRLLMALGFPARMAGSVYMMEAEALLRTSPSLINNLSKGLYVEISRRLNTKPARVERSLRSAIDAAYERGELGRLFRERPTNRQALECIQTLLEAAPPEDLRDAPLR